MSIYVSDLVEVAERSDWKQKYIAFMCGDSYEELKTEYKRLYPQRGIYFPHLVHNGSVSITSYKRTQAIKNGAIEIHCAPEELVNQAAHSKGDKT